MTFTVCDDEDGQREQIKNIILRHYPDALIIECGSAREALSASRESHVIIMDIDTGDGIDGMTAAHIIHKQKSGGMYLNALPLIIFVTGYPERMQEAFGVHAFYFLTKPLRQKEFENVLREADSAVKGILSLSAHRSSAEQDIVIKHGSSTTVISKKDILYAESRNRVQVIHTLEGNKLYSETMAELESSLGNSFCRIHRGYLVNMAYIHNYERTYVRLLNGEELSMSKYKYPEFVKKYMEYIKEAI